MVNGESICDFFEQKKTQYASSSCLNIVLDGAGYYRTTEAIIKY